MGKIKNLCRAIIVCLCLVISGLGSSFTSMAQETEVQIIPKMTYLLSYSTNLSVSDTGLATVTGRVVGQIDVTYTYVKIVLQKAVSDNWVAVAIWEDSNASRDTSINETFQLTKGTYRLVTTCTANTESITITTDSKTY